VNTYKILKYSSNTLILHKLRELQNISNTGCSVIQQPNLRNMFYTSLGAKYVCEGIVCFTTIIKLFTSEAN